MEYTPGSPVEITVVIGAFDPARLMALGLRETVPAGWEYVSIRGISGAAPPITPQAGDTPILEFAWITPPALPYTFAYTVRPPAGGGDTVFVSGQAEYRLEAGPINPDPVQIALYGPDSTPPQIVMLGDNPLILEEGIPYVEPGWIATDPEEGDIHELVQVTGTVDYMTPGDYVLTYTATTLAGLPAYPVQRIVQVIASSCTGPLCCYGGTGSATRTDSTADTLTLGLTALFLFACRERNRIPSR